jgi:peptide/nickel transport system permease protein
VFGYVARKVFHTLFVALGVITLVFVALRMSGDPAAAMLPGDASVEETVALRRTLGLDRPLYAQYASFLGSAVTGDFGTSFRHQQPAFELVLERLPATLELAFAALVLALVVALPLGILAAVYRGSAVDFAAMVFAVIGQATPYFWMGIMLILIVAVQLDWLPTSGRGGVQRLILPAVTLGTHFAASLARLTRTAMLEVLGQNFVTTARAKGLSERSVILAHALKNAAVPVVTHRLAVRHPARGRRRHGDDLRVARRGPPRGAVDLLARLPRGAGGRARARAHLRGAQPARGSALRLARSEDPP